MKTNIHFFIISRSVLLRMRNVSDKIVEQIKTHILRPTFFSARKSCCLCDNVYKCGTVGQTTDDDIQCTRIARWIPKATNTLSEYATLTAYPQQQWLL